MNHYFITIAYDGTRYDGWQRLSHQNQPNTIQQIIENALFCLTKETILINGSGRTDAGVSAKAQTADFHSNYDCEAIDFLYEINQLLPEDIAITTMQSVKQIHINKKKKTTSRNKKDESNIFHARKSAVQKHYRYSIALTQKSDPFISKYVYNLLDTPIQLHDTAFFPEVSLDMEAMADACKYLCGMHDYSAFTSNKQSEKSHVRTIHQITATKTEGPFPVLYLDFYGDGFLYNMVRIMAGTILLCGLGKQKAAEIPAILSSKLRKNAGPTLPSNGLMLVSVSYNDIRFTHENQ